MPGRTAPLRCLVLWFPDWPVTAWGRAEGMAVSEPVAIVDANLVVSCSPSARAEGVYSGQRRREAQGRCPELVVVPADQARDERLFAPLVGAIEERAPGVQVVRPGLAALRVRGPARFYGSERQAAQVLLAAMTAAGVSGVRAGVADGVFTAEQAAYEADPILVVRQGTAAEFLAPLGIERLGDAELAGLLPRLGVRQIGDFAALDTTLVRDRFGDRGVRLHTLAAGADSRPVQPRTPPPELAKQTDFEPPLTLVDQIAFTVKPVAEAFIAGLAEAGLVCTELRVELVAERGEQVERVWLHPSCFDAPAVVDRVRWQLQAAAGGAIDSPVVGVRLEPAAVDAIAHHSTGLFGLGPDERVHHVLSRVQAQLGADGVLVGSIGGGRWLAERQVLASWGDRAVLTRPRQHPWPGSLPEPLPSTVFADPHPVRVLAHNGTTVTVDDRGALSGTPAVLVDAGEQRQVDGWAGPWPVDEHAWDAARHRRACRFQLVDARQVGWLLVLEADQWWAEGRYD